MISFFPNRIRNRQNSWQQDTRVPNVRSIESFPHCCRWEDTWTENQGQGIFQRWWQRRRYSRWSRRSRSSTSACRSTAILPSDRDRSIRPCRENLKSEKKKQQQHQKTKLSFCTFDSIVSYVSILLHSIWAPYPYITWLRQTSPKQKKERVRRWRCPP